jgi:hypothetical protein
MASAPFTSDDFSRDKAKKKNQLISNFFIQKIWKIFDFLKISAVRSAPGAQ